MGETEGALKETELSTSTSTSFLSRRRFFLSPSPPPFANEALAFPAKPAALTPRTAPWASIYAEYWSRKGDQEADAYPTKQVQSIFFAGSPLRRRGNRRPPRLAAPPSSPSAPRYERSIPLSAGRESVLWTLRLSDSALMFVQRPRFSSTWNRRGKEKKPGVANQAKGRSKIFFFRRPPHPSTQKQNEKRKTK